MKKLFFLFLLFTVCACELIVDIDVPFDHQSLTINSFFNPDSLWSATVSLNRYILAKDNVPYSKIRNASVIIYDESGPVDTLEHEDDGKYISDTGRPQAGKKYRLSVSAPDYESVESESTIPIPGAITNVTFESEGNNSGTLVNVTFHDDGAEKNYYYISAEADTEWFFGGEITTDRQPLFFVNDDEGEELSQGGVLSDRGMGLLIKDVFFNGKETEIPFKIQAWNVNNYARIRVTLRTISEDYYNYKVTRDLQNQTSGDPFAQPVNVYNNIEKGFGIFAGFSQSVFIQESPRPVIREFTPGSGRIGDEVIITGENFGTDLNTYAGVFFASESHLVGAQILERSDTRIKVIVPFLSVTGKIFISLSGRIAISDTDFEVIP